MDTMRWAGLNLVLLLGAGLALAVVGAWRQELSVRQAVARLLYGGRDAEALGPPQVSRSRQLLLILGFLCGGIALTLFLLPLHRIVAVLAGPGFVIPGLLWLRHLAGTRERRESAEDVLPLVAHLCQSLGRGTTIPEALRAFAREVEPRRALARRVEGCLGAVEMGVDLHQAFDA